jgi:Tfp pilus assembly protein PilO
MSGRDRIIAMVVAVLVIVAAGWKLLVSPEREKANSLGAQIATAQGEVTTAESQLSEAHAAQAKYSSAYAAVVNLGKAVPANQEVASLIYQLEGATNSKSVEFDSIVSGAGSNASASTPAAASAGFTQMPFTFIFGGGFSNLEHLFNQLTSFTNHDASGGLEVNGRLLTVQSVKLAPASTSNEGSKQKLTGTITADAYVLPPGEGLTAGATATSPTGASSSTPAAATTTSSTSSPTAPAVARVTP